MFSPEPAEGRALPRALRLAAQGARRRRREEPARAHRRHRRGRARASGVPFRVPTVGRALRRHAGRASGRASARRRRTSSSPRPSRSTSCSPRRARATLALGRDGDRRRDPLAGADQARRAPVPLARAARGAAPARRARRSSASASRPRSARSTRSRACSAAARSARAERARSRRAPSTIVDAGAKKALGPRVEVPVDDMSPLGIASAGRPRMTRRAVSIWPSIHPRLVELIRAHRSTMIFANSRRLAERLAAAINEIAGEEIALAHHGSIARGDAPRHRGAPQARRAARPSSPPRRWSWASTWAPSIWSCRSRRRPRWRRASSASGAPATRWARSRAASIFPKYRGDLLACGRRHRAHARGRGRGDALPAQPARRPRPADRRHGRHGRRRTADALFALVAPRRAVRRPAARARSRACSTCSPGRYPSDEFAELRPRITWDRDERRARARARARGASPSINGGTIPDRGLYGVYLAERGRRRKSAPRRRARRGDGLRVARGRRLPARRVVVAHRRDHPRPRARHARARRAGQDAVLARRPPRPPARAGPRHRRARPHPARRRARRRAARASASSTASTSAPPTTCSPTCASRPRRRARCRATAPSWSSATGTSSATSASASSRPSARACTRPGAPRCWPALRDAATRTSRASGPTTAWSSASPASDDAARRGALLPRARRDRGPGRPEPRRLRRLRRALPRERRPRAAPPAPPPGPALAALGAAQEGGRSAGGGLALRLLPAPPRDVPRVPARRLRPARPRRLLLRADRRPRRPRGHRRQRASPRPSRRR